MGELSLETIFIDGSKLEACANKYTFVWRKSVGKWEENIFSKIDTAVQLLNYEYIQMFPVRKDYRAIDLQIIVDYLEQYCTEHHVEFVHGRGKRTTMHQRYYERFRKFLDRQLFYDLYNARFEVRNS